MNLFLKAIAAIVFFSSAVLAKTETITLTKDNTAVLFGEVNSQSVSEVMQQVSKLDSSLKSGYPINLFLYTPGGSIQDGLELMEYLNSLNRPVNTITLFAASMGFQLVQSQGKRYILKNGVLMSHKASGGFSGEFGDGNSQLDSRYSLWMERILEMDKHTVKRTDGKQTLKSYRAAYQNELWLTGNKAVEQGYADELITVACGKDMDGTRATTLDFMGTSVIITYSSCPLNTNPLSVDVLLPTNKGLMKYEQFLKEGGVFVKDAKEFTVYTDSSLFCTDITLTMENVRKILVESKKEAVNKQRKVIKSY